MRIPTLITLGGLLLTSACKPSPSGHHHPLDAEGAHETAPAPRVAVIGAGLAGLVAARELEKRGIPVAVIESSDLFGGRVQTAHYGNDLDAEFGMQELWAGNPLLDMARELGVALDPEPAPAFSSLLIDGKVRPFVQESTKAFFEATFSPGELKAFEGWMREAERLHALARKSGLAAPEVRSLEKISFAAWVGQAQLPRNVAEMIKLTLACELATSWDRFSALDGLLELELFFGEGRLNYHVAKGNSRLIEALSRSIKGRKMLSSTAVRVRRKADGARLQIDVDYLRHDRLESVQVERVVVAVPFVRLHQITFEPPLDEKRWEAVTSLGFGQYTVVHFLVDKEADALWLLDGRSPFPVLTEGALGVIYGVQHPTPASQPLEVFGLLIYGEAARSFHMAPRELKIQALEEELDALWPGFSKHVHGAYVYGYHPTALAVWPPGRSPLDERSALLRKPELGTYFAGDYTRGSHSSDAAESGLEVAKQIAAELGATP